jgi:hypothetical protein
MTQARAANPFSSKATRWLVGLCVVSFVAALVFAALGTDPADVPDHRPTSYSRSAIGHHGFVEILKKLDIPVVISRHESGMKAGDRAVLILAEPRTDEPDLDDMKKMLQQAKVALVVLPKRSGHAKSVKKAFIDSQELKDEYDPEAVLTAAGVVGGKVRRPESMGTIQDDQLGVSPTLPAPQLVWPATNVDPIVQTSEGILVGKVKGSDVFILADPDLIANHGIILGDNAALAVALIDKLRATGDRIAAEKGDDDDARPVIIDETLHGNKMAPSPWHELLEVPLVFATLAGILTIIILLWAAMGRFGEPVPAKLGLEPGKAFLIANTAALIGLGGHSGHALQRYLATTMQDVARGTHAPADLGNDKLRDWFDQIGKSRKLTVGLRDLEAEVESVTRARRARAERVVAAALRIYDWRNQMTSERA